MMILFVAIWMDGYAYMCMIYTIAKICVKSSTHFFIYIIYLYHTREAVDFCTIICIEPFSS
jgi:hypothetical protein